MSKAPRKNSKIKKALIIFFVLFIIGFGVVIIKRCITIKKQNDIKENLQSSVTEIVEENSKIQQTLDNAENDGYKEDLAREHGYVYPEERVYYDNDAD